MSAQILKTLNDIVLKRNYTVIFSDQIIVLVASNNYHESDTIVVTHNRDVMNIEITDKFDEMDNETVILKIPSLSVENQSSQISAYSYRKDTFLFFFFFLSIWLDDPHLTNEHSAQDCIASSYRLSQKL